MYLKQSQYTNRVLTEEGQNTSECGKACRGDADVMLKGGTVCLHSSLTRLYYFLLIHLLRLGLKVKMDFSENEYRFVS